MIAPSTTARPDALLSRRAAFQFIILIGIVSLFADMTYESARSITGPFLGVLGASAVIVSAVAGAGELLGYSIRLVSGRIGDRTGRYWALTIVGYALNLAAVPLLALAGNWEAAATLIIVERIGKGIRSPVRDAMLSHAAGRTGLGWGFGLHEAMDQAGALIGPLVLGAVLWVGYGYRDAFALLAIPAAVAMASLLMARRAFPRPRDFDLAQPVPDREALTGNLRLYLVAVGLIAAGYVDFPLIAYHFGQAHVVDAALVPVLYAGAMLSDAVAALGLGRLFDQRGIAALITGTLLGTAAAPLVFLGGMHAAVLGMILWGIGLGTQESVMRALVARMADVERRATAYGLVNAVFGVSWFAGSVLLGLVYDVSLLAISALAFLLQLAAVPPLLVLAKRQKG